MHIAAHRRNALVGAVEIFRASGDFGVVSRRVLVEGYSGFCEDDLITENFAVCRLFSSSNDLVIYKFCSVQVIW